MNRYWPLLVAAALSTSCARNVRTAAVQPQLPITQTYVDEVARLDKPVIEAELDREDSYAEAAEFYRLKRVAPGSDLPVERYAEASRHASLMPQYSIATRRFVGTSTKSPSRDANVGSWMPLGPGNIGGRTRSFVIHPSDPNIMYAGAVGGGVWKTIDGGASWLPAGDFLPSIGISALAMDPRNPDTLYAGTGEWYTGSLRGDSIRGVGIFKTTDGGTTWALITAATTTSFYYVNKIVISPGDSNRIYAATYGGVWTSLDAGVTWTRTLLRAAPDSGCQDLVIRTDKAEDYLFASCLSRGSGVQSAVFRNPNAAGGGKWEQVLAQPNMDRTSLALAPSNQSIVYAISSSQETGPNQYSLLAVYRSGSNGDLDTWETRTSGKDANRLNRALLTNPQGAFTDVCFTGAPTYTHQGEYDNAIAVDPLNPDVVWVGGIDVFRSDDGGVNWGIAGFWQAAAPQLVHADVHQLLFANGYDGNANQALFAITDGGVYRTDNAVAQIATGDRAACPPYATKVKWTNLNNGYAATQFYHGTVYPGGTAYMGGTQDNGTIRASDGTGANGWRAVRGGDGGFSAIDGSDPNILYFETTNLSLTRSTNGGASYSTAVRGISEPTTNFLFIAPFVMDPADPKRLYIGGKTLWRTIDGAQNWTEASAPVPTASVGISAIAVSPQDPNSMVFGTSGGVVYRSTNALAADKTSVWQSSQPRAGYVSRLVFDPGNANVVYATYSQFKSLATQSHVYKSIDGGANWIGIDGTGTTGIPDIPVFSLVVDPQNTATLYLGTDLGVFVSIDGGATWSRDDNPFANAVTEVLILDRSGGQSSLFAFTHGRGVWKTVLPGGGDPCQYTVPTDPVNVPAFGSTLTFNVATADGCPWSAFPVSGAFIVQSPGGGSGSGKVTTVVPQNLSATSRSGVIAIHGNNIPIQQDGALAATGNDAKETPFDMGSLPSVVLQNTTTATTSASDPVHACTNSADSKTVWFALTANETGTLRLAFANRRLDTGSDSGTVVSIYNAAGKEVTCSVLPQGSTSVITTRTLTLAVTKGEQLLIEVSASLSGSPANAVLQGGVLSLAAQIVKP